MRLAHQTAPRHEAPQGTNRAARWAGLLFQFCAVAVPDLHADWPVIRGNARHDGYTDLRLEPPYRLAWAVEFDNERLGTAMEPIVADGTLFVATHTGNLYALDSATGAPRWQFQARGPFLQSPATGARVVVVASVDGRVYGIERRNGDLRWKFDLDPGGAAASPVVADGRVFVGSRLGTLVALDVADGNERWRVGLGAPIRQTAAVADGRVFVTTEALRVFALEAGTGRPIWQSPALPGQSARDYYPVVIGHGDSARVIVRTSPAEIMSQRIAADRHLLCQNAGADDSHWQKLDAWLKRDDALGRPELWNREQAAIREYLATHRDARTFFGFEAATGREIESAPVFWAAGCQGVGTPPVRTADDQAIVLYRSAYGNWNLGVAPLVALGRLDLATSRLTPLFHRRGAQPPWNTFWGTADESQNFVVAANTLLIVHQGTLSGFDLATSNLFTIHGERDTYGGFPNPPWARNEWHGPARGGVALADGRLYWLTGSRVLCLVSGRGDSSARPQTIRAATVPGSVAPPVPARSEANLRSELSQTVNEVLGAHWAPLWVEPGLAGREFFFADTASLFEALSWAFPHLPPNERETTRAVLASEWTRRPPFSAAGILPLAEGRRREPIQPPSHSLTRIPAEAPPHRFAGLYASWLYSGRCDEEARVLDRYAEMRAGFDDFAASRWTLDEARGDVHANRYLRALLAMEQLAHAVGDAEGAERAHRLAAANIEALVGWWQRAAAAGTLRRFRTTAELDPFIGRGDAVSFRLAPHRHKVALFDALSPELAAEIRARGGDAVARVWSDFSEVYATWWVVGEERQVHYGENVVDPPDLAAGGFGALAWLREATPDELRGRLDLPYCRADLFHVAKLALTLDALGRR